MSAIFSETNMFALILELVFGPELDQDCIHKWLPSKLRLLPYFDPNMTDIAIISVPSLY